MMSNNITVKHLNRKLHDHLIFKMPADGKLDNGDKFTAFTAINNLLTVVQIHH